MGSSVVRVLARYARDPGFESRLGRVLFPPLVARVDPCSGCKQQRDCLVGSFLSFFIFTTRSLVPAWFQADSGTIKQRKIVTGRLCDSVLERYARGLGFEFWSGRVFSSPVTFGGTCGSVWIRAQTASSKGTVSSVPAWFQADLETNPIKQGGNCHRSTV